MKGTYRLVETHEYDGGYKWYIFEIPGNDLSRYQISHGRFWCGYETMQGLPR